MYCVEISQKHYWQSAVEENWMKKTFDGNIDEN